MPACLFSARTGSCPLGRGYAVVLVVRACTVLSRASSLLCGFYRHVKEKSLSLAVGTEEPRSDCKPQCEVSETVVLLFERSHWVFLPGGFLPGMCDSAMLPSTQYVTLGAQHPVCCCCCLHHPRSTLAMWAAIDGWDVSTTSGMCVLPKSPAAGAVPHREHADSGLLWRTHASTLCVLMMGHLWWACTLSCSCQATYAKLQNVQANSM